ncbi:hypothetical protein Tco_0433353 [Tanacetum coccineum]
MGRDTIQLEGAVSTISEEYLLEFTSEYGIPKNLHPEVLGLGETIVDFPEGKVGVYTRFFKFANYRIPFSQFLFDILGHCQIHLSQLSVIGAAKVSNFEINCRVHNIIPTLNLFRVFYIPSFNSGWMSFSKRPGKNTPQCYTKPLDSLKNWNNRFFWIDERIFPTVVDWLASAPRDEMSIAGSYSATDVILLNTNRAPFQRLPENLLCLVGLSQNYYLRDDVYPPFLYDDDRGSLIRNPNPFKVETGTRSRVAHQVMLLTATASRVIDMEDPTVASGSSGTPSTVERSTLDFDNEDSASSLAEGARAEEHVQKGLAHEIPPVKTTTTTKVVQEAVHEKEVAAMEPPVNKRRKQMRRKRVNEEAEANAPPKVLRKDHASGPAHSTCGGKSLTAMGLDAGFTFSPPAAQNTPTAVSDSEPQSYAKPQPHLGAAAEIPTEDVATTEVNIQLSMRSLNSGKSTSPSVGGSPGVQHEPGTAGGYRFATEAQIQAREEEIKKLDEEIRSLRTVETEVHGLRNRTQNLETLLEAEVDMKKAAEAKSVDLAGELESLRAQFSDLQVNNHQLSQQVSTLQAQVTGEERIKAAFEEFKKSEDEKVEQRCAEMDARLDALSIDFDEELYPHMLTAIAGRRWVIGHGLRLAIMKYAESTELRQAFADVVSAGIVKGMSEGLKYGVEHGEAKLDLAAIEAYDPEAEAKYVAALTALRDLKYPLVDQLEKLRDAPIDLLMASLHLESDSGDDAPKWIRELRPGTSQLKIPICPEVRNLRDPWSIQEEMLLEDAIAANRSCAEKKKKCRVVCRTHGVGSAHYGRSDGILVSTPTVFPQGLAILLTDAAVQTEASKDEASPQLLRSKSLPLMYNQDWP